MQIKIYTTTTCPYCKMEKEYLDSRGIKYENFFVDQDPSKAEEMSKLSGQLGVPFTVITDDLGKQIQILGFDREKLNESLGIN